LLMSLVFEHIAEDVLDNVNPMLQLSGISILVNIGMLN
jgi:hypothetical protein